MKYIASHSSILLKPVKFIIAKNVNNPLLVYTTRLKFHFVLGVKTWSYNIVHHRRYSGRREASFKLSNTTICVQGSKLWCSQLAIDNAFGGEKLGENMGRNGRIFTPNELDLTFWVSDYGAKLNENGDNRRGDRQTDRQMRVIL